MNNPVQAARDLAETLAPANAVDIGADVAYLDEVVTRLIPHGGDAQAVAYLQGAFAHGASPNDLESTFGKRVAESLARLEGNRFRQREGKTMDYSVLAAIKADSEHAIALIVAAATRLVDVEWAMAEGQKGEIRHYRRDHKAFRSAARREGLAPEIWEDLDALVMTRGMGG